MSITLSDLDDITVLVCDDHIIVCEGLCRVLEREKDVRVVAMAHTGAEAIEAAQQHEPDVVLVDFRLPDMMGDEVCQALSDGVSRVIMLTSYREEDIVRRCFRAGARGYVVKDVDQTQLAHAIRLVVSGASYIDPTVAPRVLSWIRNDTSVDRDAITEREREILRLIVDGQSNKEIGVAIGLAESTIKGCVQHLLNKLGVHHRLEAATVALRRGLI